MVAATYFGGTSREDLTGIATDPVGRILVSGNTESNDLPTLNPVQSFSVSPTAPFTNKGFITRFNSTLGLDFSSYIGVGINCCDSAEGIAVDAAGDVYFLGIVNVAQFGAITHRFPLSQAAEAMETALRGDGAMKVVIEPQRRE